MGLLLYLAASALLGLLQVLPLAVVARLGRWGGGLAYWLDGRHRRVALRNLQLCFGAERAPADLRRLARENFRRIGENFASAVRTAGMSHEESRHILELAGAEKVQPTAEGGPRGCVVAIGHFGNFELYAHASQFVPGFQFATTYRALRQPALDRLWQGLRRRSGCLYFERRTEGAALREAMNHQRLMIGFLTDQHAGDKGLRIPFFGHECSTTAAPAVFALRYHCPLHPAFCFRVGLGRLRIEIQDAIPTHAQGHPRPVKDITLDINRAFEAAVRRDPANWFWVHNRWKWVHARALNPPAPNRGPAADEPR